MQTMTTTSHKAAALTAASALALYDAATTTPDKLRAAAAMAEVLRASAAKAPKTKAAAGPTDLLNARNLLATLKRMTAIIERKATIPILRNVLLKAKDGRLTVYATDLDIIYSEVLRAPGMPNFRMAVPAHDLAAALKGAKGDVAFRDDTIQPEPGAMVERWVGGVKKQEPEKPDYRLTVTADGLDVRLSALPPCDFPIMRVPQLPDNVTNVDGNSDKPAAASAIMPAGALLDLLRFVRPAVSQEETRYYLNGVYLHVTVKEGESQLTAVSTDGSRLLKADLPGAAGLPREMPAMILPRKTVDWLLAHVVDEEVQLDVWENHVRLTTATGCIQSKLIDGSFPDYWRVIPSDRPDVVLEIADGKATGAALGRVLTQSKERSKSVRLTAEGGAARVILRNMEGGEAVTTLDGITAHGEISQTYNGGLLREMIETDSQVEVGLYADKLQASPAIFRWPHNPSRLGVLMPLRV